MPLSSSPFGSEPFVHFDLGVDDLASPQEIEEMDEPWIPGQMQAHHEAARPIAMPDGELQGWADGLQLPGM